jgi:Kef-type K+ transport system membrane component KefB
MKCSRLHRLILPLVLLALLQTVAHAASGPEAPGAFDIGPVLLALILIIIAAKIGSDIAVRIGQPPVLGEIALGLVVGNLALFGFHGIDYIRTDAVIGALAELGVILLLFEVGLESDIGEMARVGVSSFLVAALGVIAPFFLGFLVARAFLPHHSVYAHVFIGSVLCATSVGITARVFKDLGKLNLVEARIVLGAAVIDDVMGLLVLAVVQGIILAAGGAKPLSGLGIAIIIGKAVGFLAAALVVGQFVAPRAFRFAARLKAHDLLLAVSLAACFLFAYIAHLIQLAPIVGAFAAGLVLDKVHYKDFTDRGEHGLEHLLRPITSFLVPIFFVLMGIRVQLGAFGDWSTVLFAAALTVAAVAGKQICALGCVGQGIDRILVGLGMIPRGEVGLIVAAIGARLTLHGERIIDEKTFSAAVIVVMLTTLLTPPLLRWRMGTREGSG